jgi:GxxExxY protein
MNRRGAEAQRKMDLKQLTHQIIGAALEVHREIGPGLLESAYRQCMCHELTLRGLRFRCEVDLPVRYKGILLDCGYRIDILVEELVVLELKAVDKLVPVHEAQLLSYLKLGGWQIGLLINFHEEVLKKGIKRRVLGLKEDLDQQV